MFNKTINHSWEPVHSCSKDWLKASLGAHCVSPAPRNAFTAVLNLHCGHWAYAFLDAWGERTQGLLLSQKNNQWNKKNLCSAWNSPIFVHTQVTPLCIYISVCCGKGTIKIANKTAGLLVCSTDWCGHLTDYAIYVYRYSPGFSAA